MSPSQWGANGPISAAEFREIQAQVAAKKVADFGGYANEKRPNGRRRFNKEQSDKWAKSPNANIDHMQAFLDDDFTMADVDWNDEGWDFLAYH